MSSKIVLKIAAMGAFASNHALASKHDYLQLENDSDSLPSLPDDIGNSSFQKNDTSALDVSADSEAMAATNLYQHDFRYPSLPMDEVTIDENPEGMKLRMTQNLTPQEARVNEARPLIRFLQDKIEHATQVKTITNDFFENKEYHKRFKVKTSDFHFPGFACCIALAAVALITVELGSRWYYDNSAVWQTLPSLSFVIAFFIAGPCVFRKLLRKYESQGKYNNQAGSWAGYACYTGTGISVTGLALAGLKPDYTTANVDQHDVYDQIKIFYEQEYEEIVNAIENPPAIEMDVLVFSILSGVFLLAFLTILIVKVVAYKKCNE